MYLYLYQSENRDREELIRKALRKYCGSQKIKLTDEELRDVVIKEKAKGSPTLTGYLRQVILGGRPSTFP